LPAIAGIIDLKGKCHLEQKITHIPSQVRQKLWWAGEHFQEKSTGWEGFVLGIIGRYYKVAYATKTGGFSG
jgi:hypothetical protein